MEEKQKLNVAVCLVHYAITPAVLAEGDEEDSEFISYLAEAFAKGHATYQGYIFDGDPNTLTEVPGATNVFFEVAQSGATVFNSEADFKGIAEALAKGDGEIAEGHYYENSGATKFVKIKLSTIL